MPRRTAHALAAPVAPGGGTLLAPSVPEPPAPPAPAAATAPPAPGWGQARLIGFRFLFSYLVLRNFPSPFDYLPGTGDLEAASNLFWQAVVSWTGRHVLHIGWTLPLGGDSGHVITADYVLMFCEAALALLATLAWTVADRRSRDHRRLHDGLRVYVRYVLALILLSYGLFKIIKLQFLPPQLNRLSEPYGEMSPMGLLWTFMGYSTPYTVFTGLVEAGAGMLLFFRRTTLLGALLAVAAMANVVAINFCYDVSVKVGSSNLLLMGIFLLAPDGRRLAGLLGLARPAAPAAAAISLAPAIPARRRRPPLDPRWWRLGRSALKTLFIGYVLISMAKPRLDHWRRLEASFARAAARSSTYVVDEFFRDGSLVPSWAAAPGRWLELNLAGPKPYAATMDDQFPALDYDAARQVLAVWSEDHKTRRGLLACSRPDADHLVLTGPLDGGQVVITLTRRVMSSFFLVRRGFHWIVEAPVDR